MGVRVSPMPRKNEAQAKATVVPTRPSSRPAGTRAPSPAARPRDPAPRARAGPRRRSHRGQRRRGGEHRERVPDPAAAASLLSRAVILRHERLDARRRAHEEREERPGPDVREADGGELGRAELTDHRGVDDAHQGRGHLRDDHRPGETGDLAQATACGEPGVERSFRAAEVMNELQGRKAGRAARCGPPGWPAGFDFARGARGRVGGIPPDGGADPARLRCRSSCARLP